MAVILADTNILLRSSDPTHPVHELAFASVKKYLADGDGVCIIAQNLIEFWNVATRPTENNGFGWSPDQTDLEVTRLESLLTLLPDTPAIYPEWRKLVLAHSVRGKQVHDARIVAAMKAHNIRSLLTFNASDFKRFEGILLIDPLTV